MASEENNKQQPKKSKASDEKKTDTKNIQSPLKKGIKNRFVYIGTIGILVLTIIAFVLIPAISTGTSSGELPTFGSWNGTPIRYSPDSYFADQVSQINEYLRQQGMDETLAQMYAYQVWYMAFQNTAMRTAILDYTKRSGMKISEETLDEEVTKIAQFQVDGKFSIEKYNSTPLATRVSIRDRLRDDLLVQNYYNDMMSLSPSTKESISCLLWQSLSVRSSTSIFRLKHSLRSACWNGQSPNEALFRTIGLSKITHHYVPRKMPKGPGPR